jgi:hypothetical protein
MATRSQERLRVRGPSILLSLRSLTDYISSSFAKYFGSGVIVRIGSFRRCPPFF